MIRFLTNSKSQIIIGVIVAIIVLWLQPVLVNLRDWLISAVLKASDAFSTYYYSLLATRNHNLTSDHLLTIIDMFVPIAAIVFIYVITDTRDSLNESFDKLQRAIEALEDEDDGKSEADKIIENIREFKNLAKKLPPLRMINRILSATIVFVVVCTIFILARSSLYASASRKISEFEHKLKLVAPTMDDRQMRKLEYDWAMMKSADDYLRIEARIEEAVGDSSTRYFGPLK